MSEPGSLIERLKDQRVGVVLSAGYFGFFGHGGFVQALDEAGLKPTCWAGTSAGALVAAMAAGGLSGEEIVRRMSEVRRGDFWDPDPLGAVAGLGRGLGATGLLRGQRFRALLERSLPVRSFEECKTPLLVVATNLTRSGAQGFTRGELAPRVQASCAYPGMFRAVEVEGEHFWDGGLVDKAPVLALQEAFRPDAILVHYLPSRAGRRRAAGPFAYAQAMAASMGALRRDHFDLQLELARRSGVPVAVVISELEALGPGRLERGAAAARQARELATAALNRPAEELA